MDISRLLVLRNLTTALAEYFARQARTHLTHLAPLLHPRTLLGDLIRYEKCPVKNQDVALRELLTLYEPVARPSALNLQGVTPPLEIFGSTPDIVPATYQYTPQGGHKPVTIITPLKWVVVYKDLTPQRLRELVANHARSGGNELQSCVLHYLVMHMLATRQRGIGPVIEALRFLLTSAPTNEFAGLPFVHLSSPISTMRPPDAIILQSTQLSATTTFEEIVNMDDISALTDPVRDRVLELTKEHGAGLEAAPGA